MSHFSQTLRQLRKDAGLTQEQLAKEVGVSKSSINMYERGEREPSYKTLEKISKFFNLSIDYLLLDDFEIRYISKVDSDTKKKLRDVALKFNLIDTAEYINLSDNDIRSRLTDCCNNSSLSPIEIYRLSTEVMFILFSLTEEMKYYSPLWKDFSDRIREDIEELGKLDELKELSQTPPTT